MIRSIFKPTLVLTALALTFSSCDNDNGANDEPARKVIVITFDDSNILQAGPTSYGNNLYSAYTEGPRFTTGSYPVPTTNGITLDFGINKDSDGNYNLYNGGAVLSSWNYRTDIAGKPDGWWRSFPNQCSIYNVNSVDGANREAGADGSDTFMVINGYNDTKYQSTYCAELSFSNRAEFEVSTIMFCPTAYLYGTITNSNVYGVTPDKSLVEAGGWFKMLCYGYDANGIPTNGGNPVEVYVCDYRPTSRLISVPTSWRNWDLSALGRVNRLRFDFAGSDTNEYGLCTPAYMCLDNLTIYAN